MSVEWVFGLAPESDERSLVLGDRLGDLPVNDLEFIE